MATVAGERSTDGIRPFAALGRQDTAIAGGKGANLGELTRAGFPVPPGFVVGAPASTRPSVDATGLRERIAGALAGVDVDDAAALEAACHERPRDDRGTSRCRPRSPQRSVARLRRSSPAATDDAPVAVRSSATAEDTEAASFAGMNETFLNVRGADAVLDAVRRCWASLFGARTVFYRAKRGFGQADMDIAVVVQRQIASTRAGVMFTIDPATRRHRPARDRGLVRPRRGGRQRQRLARPLRRRRRTTLAILAREIHPQGARRSSRCRRRDGTSGRSATTRRTRPSLTDDEARAIAELGRRIEQPLRLRRRTPSGRSTPTGTIWMLQSRPVTDGRRRARGPAGEPDGEVLVRGLGAAPGRREPARSASSTRSPTPGGSPTGDVLVTHMTAPDWVPLMRRAAAIVTDSGGMTCHAAIVSRELGIPCVVGTADATRTLRDGELVTVDATRGVVLEGAPAPHPRPRRTAPRPRPRPRRRRPATQAPRQPLRALPGRAGGGARRRRRRPAARRADAARGARRAGTRACCSRRAAASEFVDRDGRRR